MKTTKEIKKTKIIKAKQQSMSNDDQLYNKIDYKFLIRFTLPTIISFVLWSVFGIIDGVFASRGISVEALSAVNFIMPYFNFAMAITSMLSMGGMALVGKKIGEKKESEARQNFSLLTIIIFLSSIIISIATVLFLDQILNLLGTDPLVLDLAKDYLMPLVYLMPVLMLGFYFTQFLVAEGKPVISAVVSVSGALVSTILNYLLTFHFEFGVSGLAWATGIGNSIPTIIGLYYFNFKREGNIYFVKPKWDLSAISRASYNGISEMITMMAATITTTVMNNIMVDLVGFEGVASAGIVMATQFIFISLYLGFSVGVQPLISHNYGQKNHSNLKKLYKKCLTIITGLSIIAVIGAIIFAGSLVRIYVEPGNHFFEMTVRGLRISAIGFFFMGFNVFAKSWFTGFNDGLISGYISFMRVMIFTLLPLITLPRFWQLNGLWAALVVAEIISVIQTIYYLNKMGSKYRYKPKSENITILRKQKITV